MKSDRRKFFKTAGAIILGAQAITRYAVAVGYDPAEVSACESLVDRACLYKCAPGGIAPGITSPNYPAYLACHASCVLDFDQRKANYSDGCYTNVNGWRTANGISMPPHPVTSRDDLSILDICCL